MSYTDPNHEAWYPKKSLHFEIRQGAASAGSRTASGLLPLGYPIRMMVSCFLLRRGELASHAYCCPVKAEFQQQSSATCPRILDSWYLDWLGPHLAFQLRQDLIRSLKAALT